MYSTEDAVTRFLKEHTGEPWQRVSDHYINFKRSTMHPSSTLCLVTPHTSRKPYPPKMGPPLYMPKNQRLIYRPQDFFDRYLQLKKEGKILLENPPWVKFDLPDSPVVKDVWSGYYPVYEIYYEVKYELSVTGDIKAKPLESITKFTIGASNLTHLSWNVKQKIQGFLQTFKVDFDFPNETLSVGCSQLGPLGSTSFKVNSAGQLEAEITPSFLVKQFPLGGLLVETQCGFKVVGTVHTYKAKKAKPEIGVVKVLEDGACLLGAILVFAVLWEATPLMAGALTGLAGTASTV